MTSPSEIPTGESHHSDDIIVESTSLHKAKATANGFSMHTNPSEANGSHVENDSVTQPQSSSPPPTAISPPSTATSSAENMEQPSEQTSINIEQTREGSTPPPPKKDLYVGNL